MFWHPLMNHFWSIIATPLFINVGFVLFLLLFKPTRWYTVAGILAFIIL